MLHIFISVPASLPPNLPISPSIYLAEEKCQQPTPTPAPKSILPMGIQSKMVLMAMSNTNGFIPNPLLPQIYGTTVLDEDVDLSDEDLELIAQNSSEATTKCSDVFVGTQQIIHFASIDKELLKPENHEKLIDYIQEQFKDIPVGNAGHPPRQIFGRIAEHIRDTAPIETKRIHGGLRIILTGPDAAREFYVN